MPMLTPLLTVMVSEAMIASAASLVWKQMLIEEVKSVEISKGFRHLNPSPS
jgi:hypothetical protein